MKICIISEPWKLPTEYYGGTQRIVSLLCEGLIERGFEISLMAGKGTAYKTKKTIYYKNQSTNLIDRAFRRLDFSIKSFMLAKDSDVIHTFKNWPNYHTIINKLNKPVIYSHQGVCKKDDFIVLKKCNPKNGYLWGVSNNQLSKLDNKEKNRIFMIPMALNTDIIKPVENPTRDYLAYIGRLNYDKGIDLAVKLSKMTGIKLKIAGEVREIEDNAKLLFKEKVEPFLGENIKFIGPINDQQKSDFLGNAKALLMLNRWDEPFGLTMAEALAAGTPIIGTNKGSIPEIIKEGENGFLCDSFQDMAQALKKLNTINSVNCRQTALNKYSKDVFINSILEMYEKVISLSKK